ncbi:MAG: hypothetical protein KAU31_14300, partial [Spirochaetaceae bacterium]|nr:hypothetical protein [Spirochaetaceae bacterium]
ERKINLAIAILTGVVWEDFNQLEKAEILFRKIRTINEEYVAKEEEVLAKLQELLSEEITEEELLLTAIEALGLIAEMEEILPDRNPRDAKTVRDLRYTVQLNIDRRRFHSLMDAAAERLAAEDYSGAAEIYINGIDDIAAFTTSGGDDTLDSPLITLDTGLDIQRRFFEEREYGLLGDQVVAARESMRTIGGQFVSVAPDALQRAADLAGAFSAGDFSDAQAKVEEYLDLLELVTEYVLSVDTAGTTLADAEAFVSQQAIEDEESGYDWHIGFLRDILLGRADSTEAEGLLVTVDSVLQIVETGPVLAARAYGDERYVEAIELLNGIAWPQEATGFGNVPEIAAVVDEADAILKRTSVSYRTYVEILAVSRSLGFSAPVPPETVGEVDQSVVRNQWIAYTESVIETLGGLPSVSEAVLRGEIASASILAASASSLRVIGQRSLDGLDVSSGRRTTVSSLNSQRAGVQFVLGSLNEPNAGSLREILSRWGNFETIASAELSIDSLSAEAARYNGSYAMNRISDLERYELNIVEDVARIEYNGLSSRLSSLRTRTDGAERQLDGIAEDVISRDESGATIRDDSGRVVSYRTIRKYPDRARDTLTPMVGRTSGSRILSTTSGEFQAALNDARAYVVRYEREQPYIASAQTIQDEIVRGQGIVAALGEISEPALFQRGRDLLQRALNEIAIAGDLESQGEDRVSAIRELIEQAHAANEAEDLDRAGDNLAQAERLLKSDDLRVRDASDLFTESLATWYRPALEDRWNETQRDLNDQIALAQADIVITRVLQAVRNAQPLVDDQRWADAFAVLSDADELWSRVFPQTAYPPLVRLLRFVETALAKQNERALREDDPDYDKLAPLLSRATQAVSEGLFADATRLLEQFLRAQPNNLEARLLEVDIALLSEEGDIATKVNRLIESTLPESVQRSEIDTLDAADALEVQSLLIAVLDRLTERSDVGLSMLSQIGDEIEMLESILSPPPIVVATPDLIAESNVLVDRSLQNGPLETLSVGDLAAALGFLEQALNVDPTNERAIGLLSLALRLP